MPDMPILTKRTLCADCGEFMSTGDAFRWVKVRVATGPSVKNVGRITHKAAHADPHCLLKSVRRTELLRAAQGNEDTLALLEAQGEPVPDMLREMLTKNAADARAQAAELK
jgi:hypothetical protein